MKELVNVNLKSFPIIFEKPGPSGEGSDDEEKANVSSIFKQSQKEDLQVSQLNLRPWRGESRHRTDKRVIWSSSTDLPQTNQP